MGVVIRVLGPFSDVVASRYAIWADGDAHRCAGVDDTDLAQLPCHVAEGAELFAVCKVRPLAHGSKLPVGP